MLSDIFTQAFIKYCRLSLEKSSNVNELYKKNPYRKGPFRSNVNVPMVTDCHVRNSAYFPHTDVMIRPFIHLFLQELNLHANSLNIYPQLAIGQNNAKNASNHHSTHICELD